MTRFWNKLHHVRSKPKYWEAIKLKWEHYFRKMFNPSDNDK